jgi:predicted TPR repeat methyltransferase
MTTFDERAATWDDDDKRARAQVVADAIRGAVPLNPQMRWLEYGAGTALLTQALRDAVGPVTLVDTSAGMREVMQQKIESGALADATIWSVDLAAEDPPDERFDVVATMLTLHHIPDLGPVLARFADLLVPGGHLCIVDLEEEDGSFHGDGFHGHHGFAQEPLTALLEAAGFVDVRFERCHAIVREAADFPLFLATAARKG